ncbi:energy-coupling factor transporter transmembrane protein EcfT [Macrococcus equipercicus]|uniref:Energy-coupling factor transporter transmembrane protein EcfT n=1 Tax=Macrococcus equipercicus TaxID=69967 RepID=A0ABQ6R6J6_9STAP|nr:energy-coupling factor transporter transmembrane component T [Macrococcus equipercicus]KAA1036906.1 energy-coupling factor transporter transmembrane protein EcfT [Macrococcus equipercicus]
MFEQWKRHKNFMDRANFITKMTLGVMLFFFVIFVHRFDLMLYIALLMLIYLFMVSGTKFKVVLTFTAISASFSLLSSLFMIFYGNGTHPLFDWGIIHITTESLFRGLHLSLRTIAVSAFGLSIAFTTEVVMIFYSLMQHLRVKPKYAYAFMASIRMLPLVIDSLFQLRNALRMRYQMIDAAHYRGINRLHHLLIPLLSQNIRKAHRLAVAMEKKGFHDGPRTYYYKTRFGYEDILLVLLVIGIIALSHVLAGVLPLTGIADVRSI